MDDSAFAKLTELAQRRELELPPLERLTGHAEHPGASALVPAMMERHASARLSLDAS